MAFAFRRHSKDYESGEDGQGATTLSKGGATSKWDVEDEAQNESWPGGGGNEISRSPFEGMAVVTDQQRTAPEQFTAMFEEARAVPASTPQGYWNSEPRSKGSRSMIRIPDQDPGNVAKRQKMGKFCPPQEFERGIPQSEKYERWKKWKIMFDIALAICDGEPTDFQKVGYLHTHVGEEVRDIIVMLELPPAHGQRRVEGTMFEMLSQGLDDYFHTLVDESTNFARFSDRMQRETESANEFAMALRHLGVPVGINHGTTAFRHRFLEGLSNRTLAERAMEEGLPIAEVIRRAGRIEQSAEVSRGEQSLSHQVQPVAVMAVSGNVEPWKRGEGRAKRQRSVKQGDFPMKKKW